MAKKNGSKGAAVGSTGAEGAADSAVKLPAGFRRRSTVSDANWVAQEKGNVVYGKLLGRHMMQTDPVRYYYQVELKAPCKVREGRGEDAQIIDAEAGEVVNVNENFKIACLKEIEIPEILAGGEYDVYIDYQDKQKIGGGKTMWNIDVQSKQLKAPTSPVRPLPKDDESAAEGGEGDAPF